MDRDAARRIESPPAHFGLLALLLVAALLLLVAEGLTEHRTGESRVSEEIREPGDRAARDAARPPRAASWPVEGDDPGRRIALTFDDGPDPRVDTARSPRPCSGSTSRRPSSWSASGSSVTPASSATCDDDGFELGEPHLQPREPDGPPRLGARPRSSR